jgi:adenine/guanine/hypoxanthine permease
MRVANRWWVKGDLDGFFGLFIDNLLQLMVIAVLGRAVCGFPDELVNGRILPGAAISILGGNLFYAWQARRLALRSGREDVTALPYGINTPSVFAFILFIMGPIYQETHDATLAWRAGLAACFLSGVMETAGAFCGDWVRRHTPRAALLSALAGIAISFIAMGFVFQIFASPALALLPMMMILVSYAAKIRWPMGLPGGLLAVAMGTGMAWGLKLMGVHLFQPAAGDMHWRFYVAQPAVADLGALLFSPLGWKYLAVIFPMGLFNVIGSLQNLESAEAGGDRFETRSSLLANGLGSIGAALMGSAFPTTIYIGHPGWKAMGARYGYSILNGAVITLLCFCGGMPLVLRIIPLEAVLGILMWIGLIITAQAFQDTPRQHALAVALGLLPSLAAWGVTLIETALRKAGSSLHATAASFGSDLYIFGLLALNQGFLLTAMVLSAMLAYAIDRDFLRAGFWALAGAVLSFVGIIHAFELTQAGICVRLGWLAAPQFVAGYGLTAMLLFGLHLWQRPSKT